MSGQSCMYSAQGSLSCDGKNVFGSHSTQNSHSSTSSVSPAAAAHNSGNHKEGFRPVYVVDRKALWEDENKHLPRPASEWEAAGKEHHAWSS